MKIVQVSDPHICRVGETNSFGVDVRDHFLRILEEVRQVAPDFFVLSGDLCMEEGDAEIYGWVRAEVDAMNIPYCVISGNHDNSELLASSFGVEKDLKATELYFDIEIDNRKVLFLDTAVGDISDVQAAWLQENLQKIDGPALVFMHHPPLLGAMPFMDTNYPFLGTQKVQQIFFAHPHSVQVFCGHYHLDKFLSTRNLQVHITPSTYFQINPFFPEFKTDHFHPGFREITLNGDLLTTMTRYL